MPRLPIEQRPPAGRPAGAGARAALNDAATAGEEPLGSFLGPDMQLLAELERRLARGEAVRLFMFDSHADMGFEELLEPA